MILNAARGSMRKMLQAVINSVGDYTGSVYETDFEGFRYTLTFSRKPLSEVAEVIPEDGSSLTRQASSGVL